MASKMPDFERAQYTEARTIEGNPIGPAESTGGGMLVRAILFGLVAAVVGAVGYGLIGFSGYQVSLVAIGVGWLVAKAMMTGSGGIGGRPYQIAAVVLTYFAVSTGNLMDALHFAHIPLANVPLMLPFVGKEVLAGPFLELASPFNGALGLLILAIGLRAAWRVAAGSPGLGGGGPRVTPFGVR